MPRWVAVEHLNLQVPTRKELARRVNSQEILQCESHVEISINSFERRGEEEDGDGKYFCSLDEIVFNVDLLIN